MPTLGRRLLLPFSVLVLLTACSSALPPDPTPSSSVSEGDSFSAADEEPETWSMTGLPMPADRSERPILAVKVDNTASGQPQLGIGRADVVVQGPVEGGATRLAAFFESKSPHTVGPVRSIRTSDIGAVKPADAIIVASGGAPMVSNAMTRADVTVHAEGSPGLFRDQFRSAPYNLFADLATVRESVTGKVPRKPYLAFGEFNAPSGVTIRRVVVDFSAQSSERWTYNEKSESWKRRDQSAGGTFMAKNLLIFRVKLRDAGYRDPAGNSVPEIVTSGSGKGWLAVGKEIQPIRWSKKSPSASWELATKSGSRIELPAGKSWISLLPKKTGGVKYR